MADLNAPHGTVTGLDSHTGAFGPGANAIDGDHGTHMTRGAYAWFGAMFTEYVSDLGDDYIVAALEVIEGFAGWPASQFPVYGSADGSSWDLLPATVTTDTVANNGAGGGLRIRHTYTLDDEATYRYWKLRRDRTAPGAEYQQPVTLAEWTILEGTGGPPPDPPAEPPPYVPPDVARALIEAYVPDPDASRWGEGLWGAAPEGTTTGAGHWSSARWTDITPWCESADVAWGAQFAEAGILADTDPGVGTIVTYDPDRVLDPSNADSPYAPAIVPGLPIRVSHRGAILRTGHAERIRYSFGSDYGAIRLTDNVARLAGAKVPSDTVLSDTLRARARDAIAAAGLVVTVEPDPPSGDPAVAAWDPGTFSAWDLIAHTAREVLHVPYIDHVGTLRFRAWDAPLARGAEVGSPELVDLVAEASDDSLYSVVVVNDATSMTTVERRVTPLPRYGERTHRRTLATINGDTWADRVLLDRSATGLRWRPGRIRPVDATSLEAIAAIETLELVTLSVDEADPAVEVRVRVMGVRFRVIDLGAEQGPDWSWWLVATTAAAEPLIMDGSDPAIYLTDDADGELLYPDGVVVIA